MSKRKTNTSVQQVRQGDVLITAAPMPADLAPIDRTAARRGLVLAEGEATGHAHTIAWDKVGTAGIAEDGSLCFDASEGAAVTHEEHSAIPLWPQSYRVTIQREYGPAEVRNVAD